MTRTVIAFAMFTAAAAFGQAVVERAIMTGAGVTRSAGAAKGAGESVGAVFGGLKTTLDRTAGTRKQEAASSPKTAAVVITPAARDGDGALDGKAEPVPDLRSDIKPEDVNIGMSYEQLVQVAGKPALRISQPGKEALTFALRSGGSIDVIITDGKVSEVKLLKSQ